MSDCKKVGLIALEKGGTRTYRFFCHPASPSPSPFSQSWKAATLEGWRLHHDPNFASLAAAGHPTPIEGNPLRRLWKNAAWSMAEDDRVALYERALYAALTGNLTCLLRVVDSWEDALWAYCRALVDQRTEEALEARAMPFAATPQSLPPRFNDKELTIERISR